MRRCSPARRQRLVNHLPVERVSESVVCGDGSVRPLFRLVRCQKQMTSRELRARFLHGFEPGPQSCRHRRCGKRQPGRACALQQPPLVVRKASELMLDEFAHTGRDGGGKIREFLREPVSGFDVEQATSSPLLQKCFQKQGMTFGVAPEQAPQLGSAGCLPDPHPEIGSHGVLSESGQGQGAASVASAQFVFDPENRIFLVKHLDRPVTAQHQYWARHTPLSPGRQPVQGGGVAPMQVFQYQDAGAFGGESFQGFDQFAAHPFGACIPGA